MTEAGQVKDKDRCPLSKHVDGKSHGWLFWGDDPYIKCDWCVECDFCRRQLAVLG